jgi:hypothetical protein
VGKEKLVGLPGERLSLVHRYMTDVAAEAVPEPKPTDVPPPGPDPRAQPPIAPVLAQVSAPVSEPDPASAVSAPPPEAAETSEHRLPIHEWSRADASKEERRNDVDWAHALLRSREDRDRLGETPS